MAGIFGKVHRTAAGVTERGWAPIVRDRAAPRLRGGMQMTDVRDVAELHARLMTPGQGPRRYLCGGTMVTFDEMIDTAEAGCGQRIRRIPLSPGVFRAIGWFSDLVGGVLPLGDGISYEAAMLLTAATFGR